MRLKDAEWEKQSKGKANWTPTFEGLEEWSLEGMDEKQEKETQQMQCAPEEPLLIFL